MYSYVRFNPSVLKRLKPIVGHPEDRSKLWEVLSQYFPKYFTNLYLPTVGKGDLLLDICRSKLIKENSLYICDNSIYIENAYIQAKTNLDDIKEQISVIASDRHQWIQRINRAKVREWHKNPSFLAAWWIAVSHMSYSECITFDAWNHTMLRILTKERIRNGVIVTPIPNFDYDNLNNFNKLLQYIQIKTPNNIFEDILERDVIFCDFARSQSEKMNSTATLYYNEVKELELALKLIELAKEKIKIFILVNEKTPRLIIDYFLQANFKIRSLEFETKLIITKKVKRTGLISYSLITNYNPQGEQSGKRRVAN